MIVYYYLLLPLLLLTVDASSIRGRINKNEVIPLKSTRSGGLEKDGNNLKVVSGEPFIIQLQVPKPDDSKQTTGKDKKRKRPAKKRISKLRKKHRTRRDLLHSRSKRGRQEKSKTLETPLTVETTEREVKNQTKNTINRTEVLKALSSYSRTRQNKRTEFRGFEEDDKNDSQTKHPAKAPVVKMTYPSAPKTDRHSHKYSYKDLMADRKRLEQKINYIKNMLSANDSSEDDAVRIRRRSESDKTANKIAKMFLTLSAVNGLHDKRKYRCAKGGKDDDDDEDRVQDVWEKERKNSPSRKSSSSNEERYKIKKWIEFLKNKRSSGKTCPCLENLERDDSDAFPLEQRLPKDYFLLERSRSSEESSEAYRDPFYRKPNRDFNSNRRVEGQDGKGKPISKSGKKKLDLPLTDLELYRSRAKLILQNAEEILDKIKEEEEKRLSTPNILRNRLKELTSRIQSDPRNNENDLIRKIQKNLGWSPSAKSKEGSEGNTFIDNVKSYILDPYEKAKELTDESTKMLSSYLLRNLGKMQESSEEAEAKDGDEETRADSPQVYFGQVPTKEEEKPLSASLAKEDTRADLLSKSKQDLEQWEETISTILHGNEETVKKEPVEEKRQEEKCKSGMEDMIGEQQKKLNDYSASPHSGETPMNKTQQNFDKSEQKVAGKKVKTDLPEKGQTDKVELQPTQKDESENNQEKSKAKDSTATPSDSKTPQKTDFLQKQEDPDLLQTDALLENEEELNEEILDELKKTIDEKEKKTDLVAATEEETKEPEETVGEKLEGQKPRQEGGGQQEVRNSNEMPMQGLTMPMKNEQQDFDTDGHVESEEPKLRQEEEEEENSNETPLQETLNAEDSNADKGIAEKSHEARREGESEDDEVVESPEMGETVLRRKEMADKRMKEENESEEAKREGEREEDEVGESPKMISGRKEMTDKPIKVEKGDELDEETREEDELGESPQMLSGREETTDKRMKEEKEKLQEQEKEEETEEDEETVSKRKEVPEKLISQGEKEKSEEEQNREESEEEQRDEEEVAEPANTGETVSGREEMTDKATKQYKDVGSEEPKGEEESEEEEVGESPNTGETASEREEMIDELLKKEKVVESEEQSREDESKEEEVTESPNLRGTVSERKVTDETTKEKGDKLEESKGEDSGEEEEVGNSPNLGETVSGGEEMAGKSTNQGNDNVERTAARPLPDADASNEETSSEGDGNQGETVGEEATNDETLLKELKQLDAELTKKESELENKSAEDKEDEQTHPSENDEKMVRSKDPTREDTSNDETINLQQEDTVLREAGTEDTGDTEGEARDEQKSAEALLESHKSVEEEESESPNLKLEWQDAEEDKSVEESGERQSEDVKASINQAEEEEEQTENEEVAESKPKTVSDNQANDDEDGTQEKVGLENQKDSEESVKAAPDENQGEESSQADEGTLLRATNSDKNGSVKEEEEDKDDETPLKEERKEDGEEDATVRAENPGEQADRRPSGKNSDEENKVGTILKETDGQIEENPEDDEEETMNRKEDEILQKEANSEEEQEAEEELQKARNPDEAPTTNEEQNADEPALQEANPELNARDSSEDLSEEKEGKTILKSANTAEAGEDQNETPDEMVSNTADAETLEADGKILSKSAESMKENTEDAEEDDEDEETKEETPLKLNLARETLEKDEDTLDEASLRAEKPDGSEEKSAEKSGEALKAAFEDLAQEEEEEEEEPSLKESNPNFQRDPSEETLKETSQSLAGADETTKGEVEKEDGDLLRAALEAEETDRAMEEEVKEADRSEELQDSAARNRQDDSKLNGYDAQDTRNSEPEGLLLLPLVDTKNLDDSEEQLEHYYPEYLRSASLENELDSTVEQTPMTGETYDTGSSRKVSEGEENEDETPLQSTEFDEGNRNNYDRLREEHPLGENLILEEDEGGNDANPQLREEGDPNGRHLPDLLQTPGKSSGRLKVPKSIGEIMKDLEGKTKDDITSIQNLDPEKIDDIIDKIGEAEQQSLLESAEVDCRKECACADEIDSRSRNIGRYEIVKDFLHWMKDLKLNRVLADD